MSILSFSALAEDNNIFLVKDIHVDVTSISSLDARKQALAEGQSRSFDKLLRRLVMSHDLNKLPSFDLEEINEFIRDFAVNNEKNSPVRYIADLSFRFKARQVRSLLRDLGVEFAETPSKPILVLPIYEIAAAKVLWDTPNAWKEAWAKLKIEEGLVPIRLPNGDLKDIGTIGAEQAIEGDEHRIKAIGSRYNVDTVTVAYARLNSNAKGKPEIRVGVVSYGSDKRAGSLETLYSPNAGESVDDMLKRIANLTATTIDDLWKKDNLLKFGEGSVLSARLPINGLTDWVELRRRLKKVAVIERIDLVMISRNQVVVNIFYLGKSEQLSLALAQADVNLMQNKGGWIMRLQKAKPNKS